MSDNPSVWLALHREDGQELTEADAPGYQRRELRHGEIRYAADGRWGWVHFMSAWDAPAGGRRVSELLPIPETARIEPMMLGESDGCLMSEVPRTLAAEWAGYDAHMIANGAPKADRERVRLAFYAGAGCAYSMMMAMAEPGRPIGALGDDVTRLGDELVRFHRQAKQRAENGR